jgi:hypothetical protein
MISITQTESTYRPTVDPLPKYTATGSSSLIAWTATNGTFNTSTSSNGQQITLTPDNRSRTVTVTARDTGTDDTVSVTLEVTAVFPYQPDWRSAGRAKDDKTNVSLAEDNSPSFVVKGETQRVFKYGFNERLQSEYVEADDFWEHHRKTRVFVIRDYPRTLIGTPLLIKVRFDSEFDDDPQGLNNISYSFVLREAIDA